VGVAGCMQNLSIIAFLEEDYSKAYKLRQECLAVCQKIGFTWGIASAIKHLGDVDKALGDYPKARQRYAESLAISEKSEDRRSAAFTLNSLGGLALLEEEYRQALDYYQRALKIADEINVVPLFLDIIMGISDLWIREGKGKDALVLITFALNHPGIEKQTKNRAIKLKSEVETQLTSIELQQTVEKVQTITQPLILQKILSNRSFE
jgi:tetratricopeptide (TPR) repeat protein